MGKTGEELVKEKKTTPLPHDGPTDPGKKGEETKPSF
jgi:hypothetical protein